MNQVICKTTTFNVEVPEQPFVSREDGGHLRLMSTIKVKDRTELTYEQMIEYALLSEVIGKALKEGMTKQGIEVGNINWQEMGNWSVFKPEGITLHMHIFGRAINARTQIYGEAVKLPFRDTGFYDTFAKLNEDDIVTIQQQIAEILKQEKYQTLTVEIV